MILFRNCKLLRTVGLGLGVMIISGGIGSGLFAGPEFLNQDILGEGSDTGPFKDKIRRN